MTTLNQTVEISNTTQKVSISGNDQAVLYQNIPNPFSGKTIIQYYIPEDAGNAYIQITTVNGAVLKTINVTKGNGQIELEIK